MKIIHHKNGDIHDNSLENVVVIHHVALPTRPAHRPPLPPEQRQDSVIRERVTQEVRAAYEQLGGKAWLLQAITKAKRLAK